MNYWCVTPLPASIFLVWFHYYYLHKITESYQDEQVKMLCLETLSKRENEVLDKMLKGKNTKTIGVLLFIQEGTVRNHIKNIYQKLGVNTKEQLFSLFLR